MTPIATSHSTGSHCGSGPGAVERLRRRVTVAGLSAALLVAGLPGALCAQVAAAETEGGHPVLLELYTAQGCASCPPADEMLAGLAGRDDVIALALHVDYWDYIGWADTFADHDYTLRQQRYARRYGHSTIYTPQVVINGTEIMEGFRVTQVMEAIDDLSALAPEVSLSLSRPAPGRLEIRAVPEEGAAPPVALASRRAAVGAISAANVSTARGPAAEEASAEIARADSGAGGVLEIRPPAAALAAPAPAPAPAADAAPMPPLARIPVPEVGPYTVQLVRYRPADQVDIQAGENAGLQATYTNIVTSWQVVANWDMLGPLELTVPLEGDEPAVVLVQEVGQGEVVGAARLR